MHRSDDLVILGRRLAASQGVVDDDRSRGEWLAYGQACQDALAAGRSIPAMLPPSHLAPPAAPLPLPLPLLPPPVQHITPLQPGAVCAACGHAAPSRTAATPVSSERPRSGALSRVVWGLTWRYGILAAVFTYAAAHNTSPWLPLAAVVVVGVVLGLHRRSWVLARMWRAVVVSAGAVFVGPLFPAAYPDVLVGSLGALTAAPLWATWRRRGHRRSLR